MRHVVAIGAAAILVLGACTTTAAPSSAPPRPSIGATPDARASQAVAPAATPSSRGPRRAPRAERPRAARDRRGSPVARQVYDDSL